MSRRSCNPAVSAGLIAATLGYVPVEAQAAGLPGATMGSSSEFLFAFLFGCAAGVTAAFVAHAVRTQNANQQSVQRTQRANRFTQKPMPLVDLDRAQSPEPNAFAQAQEQPAAEELKDEPVFVQQKSAPLQVAQLYTLPSFEPTSNVVEDETTAPYTPEQFAQAAAESKARADRRAAGPAHMAVSRELRYKVAKKRAASSRKFAPNAALSEVPTVAEQALASEVDPWSQRRMSQVDELSHGLFVVPDTTTRQAIEDRRAKHFGAAHGSDEVTFTTVGATPDEADIESSAPAATYYSTLYAEPLEKAEHIKPVQTDRTSRSARSRAVPKRPDDTASREAYRIYDEEFQSQVSSGSERVAPDQAHGAPVQSAGVSEYERVATEYAREKRKKGSAMERLRGVAAILQERLGASMMDGMPVISRADGTVGDVGTSWWNDTMGNLVVPAEQEVSVSVPNVVDMGTEAMAKRTASIAARISKLDQEAAVASTGPSDYAQQVARQSELIESRPPQDRAFFSRLPEVDQAVRSERAAHVAQVPTAKVAREQAWAVALEELGGTPFTFTSRVQRQEEERRKAAEERAKEAYEASQPNVEDIDEPDGLEGTTNIIPFKAVGGHPEVVDASSYVDFLIEDEFAKNKSAVAREQVEANSVRATLRVMDGGTAGWKSDAVKGAPEDEDYEELAWLEAREA